MFVLKRFFAFILMAALTASLVGCKRTNKLINSEIPIKEQAEFTIVGEWTVAKVERKRTEDIIKKTVSDVLADYFKEGMVVTYKNDGTATCGDNEILYGIEGDRLRIEWVDGTRNFNLYLEGDNNAVEMSSNEVIFITLTRNK